MEFEVLPGLAPVLVDELSDLGFADVELLGENRVRALGAARQAATRVRTAVAAYSVTHFAVPRPRALLGHQSLSRLVAAVAAAGTPDWSPTAVRLAGAGSESNDFRRLRAALSEALSLPPADDGDLVVRVVRSRPDAGWDVLVRLTPRPLSARGWRVRDFRGALNATIAAAMVRLAAPRRGETVVNVMCGSGTLMAEHLLAGGDHITGVDVDRDANSAAGANLAAAGVAQRSSLVAGDVARLPVADGSVDLAYCDLPYGQAVGSHAENDALYPQTLSAVWRASRGDARFVVITHDIDRFETALARGRWMVERDLQVFQKGHHPRIWLLRRMNRRSR